MAPEPTNFFSGLVLLVLSAVLYFYLIPNYVESSETGAMSPRFFPRIGAMLVGAGGLALTVASLLARSEPSKSDTSQARNFGKSSIALLVALAMASFILVFQHLGYFYAAPLTLVLLMLLFGARNPVQIVIVAGVTTAALYAIFRLGLNLPLV